MEQLTLQPITKINGTVNLPGSKSVSNRALLLAALAEGKTRLTNLLDSDDIRHMLNALAKLGVTYELSNNNTVCEVSGLGGAFSVDEAQEHTLAGLEQPAPIVLGRHAAKQVRVRRSRNV